MNSPKSRLLLLAICSACVADGQSPMSQDAVTEAWGPMVTAETQLPPPAPCPPGAAAVISGVSYPDLQDALDASVAWDVVKVCRGTHAGNFVLPHPGPIQILGETGNPADVVLDAQDRGKVLNMYGGNTLRLRGLTIANGNDQSGSAFDRYAGGPHVRLELIDLVIEGHVAENNILSITTSHLSVVRTVFRDNVVETGTVLILDNVGLVGPTELRFDRCLFEDNTATAGSGGALNVFIGDDPGHQGSLRILDSTFRRNHAPFQGGAVYAVVRDEFDMIIDRTTFEENAADHTLLNLLGYTDADEQGGAVVWHTDYPYPGRLLLRDSTFIGNQGGYTSALFISGAPRVVYPTRPPASSRVILDNVQFLRNGDGSTWESAAFTFWPSAHFTFRNVLFGSGADGNEDNDLNDCGFLGAVPFADFDAQVNWTTCP